MPCIDEAGTHNVVVVEGEVINSGFLYGPARPSYPLYEQGAARDAVRSDFASEIKARLALNLFTRCLPDLGDRLDACLSPAAGTAARKRVFGALVGLVDQLETVACGRMVPGGTLRAAYQNFTDSCQNSGIRLSGDDSPLRPELDRLERGIETLAGA